MQILVLFLEVSLEIMSLPKRRPAVEALEDLGTNSSLPVVGQQMPIEVSLVGEPLRAFCAYLGFCFLAYLPPV